MYLLIKRILFYFYNPHILVNKILYFVLHPVHLIKWKLNLIRLANYKDINSDPNITSNLKIDVVFPTIGKDFEVVVHMIDSVREFVKHPIGDIYVISPPTDEIKEMCARKSCIFVDENTMLPVTIKDINYKVNGQNRSGWILQQLLKYAADKLVKTDHFLVSESDTVFIRPRVFEHNGKFIFPCSTDFPHIPYFTACEKLYGDKIEPVVNLTSHHALYSKKYLSELKQAMEKHCGMVWYKSFLSILDPNEGSCVSDYDTYGQYVLKHHPESVILEHWGNLSLPRREIVNLSELRKRYKDKYKVISFHSYND